MRAGVTLTPSESEKLLAKAVAVMDPIKKAMQNGRVPFLFYNDRKVINNE